MALGVIAELTDTRTKSAGSQGNSIKPRSEIKQIQKIKVQYTAQNYNQREYTLQYNEIHYITIPERGLR